MHSSFAACLQGSLNLATENCVVINISKGFGIQALYLECCSGIIECSPFKFCGIFTVVYKGQIIFFQAMSLGDVRTKEQERT